ncbi:hypothetical protein M0R45_034830 [Rubus argutus]|uniref:C2H2-type domain-containing protein n=1 Tax=Rubus argutus TaxID=59490 RepID=A0AAW1VU97_RUBAR
MERHKCKLCMRSFSNGRALGGSHEVSHDEPPNSSKARREEEEQGEEEEEDEEGMYYGLRENPKRSIRLVDPEFSFAVDAGSVVLQDRESETESSKNPTRRRSKRTRKSALLDHHHQQQQQHQHQLLNQYHDHAKLNQHHQEALKKIKLKNKIDSWAYNVEPEPVSSISDATTEEDVAFCLMMLSRDKWKKQDKQQQEEHDDQEEDVEAEYRSLDDSDESEEQLIKFQRPKKSSLLGKRLVGHKRSHVTGSAAINSTPPVKSLAKLGDNMIDLNLPAPVDDDEMSQIELSAVSDAEFVRR